MLGKSWMKKGLLYLLAILLALAPDLFKFGFPHLDAQLQRPESYLIRLILPVFSLFFVYLASRVSVAPPISQSPAKDAAPAVERPVEPIDQTPFVHVDDQLPAEPELPERPSPIIIDDEPSMPPAPRTPEVPAATALSSPVKETIPVSLVPIPDSELLQMCDDSPHVYCVADFSGQIIEANEAAKQLYHLSGLERARSSWYDMIHPEDQHRTAMAVSTLLAGDSRITAFRNRIRGQGGYRWMDWNALSKYEARRLYIVGQDVTEYQSAFLALSDSELRFRVAFNSMHEGMLLVDSHGVLTLVNRSAQNMLGVLEEEAVGRRIFPSSVPLLREDGSTLTPEDHPLAKALSTGEAQPDLVFGFHNDQGELKWIEANAVPLFHQGESVPYAAVSTLSDVTENREINDQIQTYMVTLESQKEQLELANARLEEANHQLQTLATTDAVTGLRNHRAFQERLVEEIMRAERYKTPLSLILLDVDQFKSYNDSFGHPAGDEVLRRLADILREHARTHDLVARYGGEEFILLTPHTDLAGAEVVAERCRQAIEKVPWSARAVTASFGIATLGYGIETGAELIACADHALYAAKAGGRNRVSLYAPSLGKTAQN